MIQFDVVGLDVGFENPQFAVLELNYADSDADPTGGASRRVARAPPRRGRWGAGRGACAPAQPVW